MDAFRTYESFLIPLYRFHLRWDRLFPYYNSHNNEARASYESNQKSGQFSKQIQKQAALAQTLEDMIVSKKLVKPFGRFGIMGILGALGLAMSVIDNHIFGIGFLLLAATGAIATMNKKYVAMFTIVTGILLAVALPNHPVSGITGMIGAIILSSSLATWMICAPRRSMRHKFVPIEVLAQNSAAFGIMHNPLLLGFTPTAYRGIFTFDNKKNVGGNSVNLNPYSKPQRTQNVLPTITIGSEIFYVVELRSSLETHIEDYNCYGYESLIDKIIVNWKSLPNIGKFNQRKPNNLIIINGQKNNTEGCKVCARYIPDLPSSERIHFVENRLEAFKILASTVERARPLSWCFNHRLFKRSIPAKSCLLHFNQYN